MKRASVVAQKVEESACNAGDLGLIPGQGRPPRRREWQLSCCISLCTLFAEPRIGAAQAKRLEEDAMEGAIGTADTIILSWLMQQT